jgi:hypothetical protein
MANAINSAVQPMQKKKTSIERKEKRSMKRTVRLSVPACRPRRGFGSAEVMSASHETPERIVPSIGASEPPEASLVSICHQRRREIEGEGK